MRVGDSDRLFLGGWSYPKRNVVPFIGHGQGVDRRDTVLLALHDSLMQLSGVYWAPGVFYLPLRVTCLLPLIP